MVITQFVNVSDASGVLYKKSRGDGAPDLYSEEGLNPLPFSINDRLFKGRFPLQPYRNET